MHRNKENGKYKEFAEQNLLEKDRHFLLEDLMYVEIIIKFLFHLCFREKVNTSNSGKCPTLSPLQFGILHVILY